ncbi:tripartite tricarboxylate transporter substrate binding protein [Marinovum sp. 2_MG-2023]|uniref:tripartite tricarboxylate transporter substrate binding protein n=1 Tax=unclassified Marinovum TaxID=2647166 RepID=UPI0026E3808B|nr:MULTISPECIES: tripartite tricarboxylate transporter substrate binding protein [unclassified Marinovum]MDO6732613.1 tripartite tricarboxylate transporter substrate binding protein [Marinovum sp. 2_MG-2023]MDO6781912.1 tripartite tricarboxylate transporter substrate binding protein [Marinovum sp. 1_MG-2023]
MNSIKSLIVAAVATAAFAGADEARAEYPEKPINMIIGFAAGGGTDLAGRVLAKELQDAMGQPVVVVNQPGAASMIAAANVAKARPDGYTIWFGSAGTLVTQQELGRTPIGKDDLTLAGLTGHLVAAIGVPVDSPFQAVGDIVAAAKERPGELRWSHNGVGSAFMAMGQGFVTANGLDVVGVPFQGAANLRQALTAKQVDFGVLNAGDRLRLGDKDFRILGVIAKSRDLVLDDELKTLDEEGVAFIDVPSPIGVYVPADLPEEVVARLSDAIKVATESEGFIEGMENIDIPVTHLGAEDATGYVEEIRKHLQEILPHLRG